jgi:hypothetical protein
MITQAELKLVRESFEWTQAMPGGAIGLTVEVLA